MVLVDYKKCTGCRTFESVCSAYNNPIRINVETLLGLGNPVSQEFMSTASIQMWMFPMFAIFVLMYHMLKPVLLFQNSRQDVRQFIGIHSL